MWQSDKRTKSDRCKYRVEPRLFTHGAIKVESDFTVSINLCIC